MIFILVAGVAALLFTLYSRKETHPATTGKETYVTTEEKYGKPLLTIADSILSPLDTEAQNPIAELTRLSSAAETDAHNGCLTTLEANIIIRLCSRLKSIYTERSRFENEHRVILTREYHSLDKHTSETKIRQRLLTDHLQGWQELAEKYRPLVASDLSALRQAGRH